MRKSKLFQSVLLALIIVNALLIIGLDYVGLPLRRSGRGQMVDDAKEFLEQRRRRGGMNEESLPSPKRRRRYDIDREKALGVAIALGLLGLVGAVVGAFIPDPYGIPVSLLAYFVLLITVTRILLPRIPKRKATTPSGTPEGTTE